MGSGLLGMGIAILENGNLIQEMGSASAGTLMARGIKVILSQAKVFFWGIKLKFW